MYRKDFDIWNKQKKKVDASQHSIYFKERELWWCNFGVNIGVEIDGKHHTFERPALLLKCINRDMVFVLPLTTKATQNRFHVQILTKTTRAQVKITQGRTISTKRLLRKIETIPQEQYNAIQKRFIEFILR